jgi:hypothetical protein
MFLKVGTLAPRLWWRYQCFVWHSFEQYFIRRHLAQRLQSLLENFIHAETALIGRYLLCHLCYSTYSSRHRHGNRFAKCPPAKLPLSEFSFEADGAKFWTRKGGSPFWASMGKFPALTKGMLRLCSRIHSLLAIAFPRGCHSTNNSESRWPYVRQRFPHRFHSWHSTIGHFHPFARTDAETRVGGTKFRVVNIRTVTR